ncbi:hypothetical protein ABZV93_22205 [Actinopolymorpha sp. NPDC004070]|uniref:hypothetical protein n=1 Tax=Actinopolymorpha sp. NPDC004070 TaxID=3154548 RepID=UPI0033BC25A0
MDSPRLIPPWVIFGVVALIVGVSSIVSAPNPQDSPPDLHERRAVEEQLRQVEGIRPVLPTILPPGYDFARDYEPETSSDGATSGSFDDPGSFDSGSFDGSGSPDVTIAPAASWSVYFFPTDGPHEGGLPVVIVCVQKSNIKDEFCPAQDDATHLHRHLDQTPVVISRVSPGSHDMRAWRDVELTTDLAKVTWLR